MKKSKVEHLKKNITFLEKVNAKFQVKLKKEQHKSSRYEMMITELKKELEIKWIKYQ